MSPADTAMLVCTALARLLRAELEALRSELEREHECERERATAPGDVVQLVAGAPFDNWGPLLAIVDDVRDWGVVCSAFLPGERGTPPGRMPMRVAWAELQRIGRASLVPVDQ